MPEHYDPGTLRISRDLYGKIRDWGRRGGVTLIGGWAVYERVKELRGQQSRDVDLIIHDLETLVDFDRRLRPWGLTWRTKGRNRFNDCHLIGDDPANIRVDIFKATNFEDRLFKGPAMRGAKLVKPAPTTAWLPSVLYLIQDKLATIPKRRRDREDKRLKDFIDIYNLAFHNRDGQSARALADATKSGRAAVGGLLEAAKVHDQGTRRGAYADELEVLETWLRS